MNWVFMICQEMYMSGVLIGMELTVHLHRRILLGLLVGRSVLVVEVARSSTQGIVGHLAVAAMQRMAAT